MSMEVEFSNPVVVEEGVAFRVQIMRGCQKISQVVVATKSCLGVGDDAQGLALLGAFARASCTLRSEALKLFQATGPSTVIYLRKG
ncbi:hypothetical protein [Caldimonas tepidiphila]|uniref:hypothetical protein n=1 Tax=Caldimonas tepidiphila TaxID=2315841 RepID=UPI00130020BA|nr:hypothetical protein [Caldimonas tepidiphila]